MPWFTFRTLAMGFLHYKRQKNRKWGASVRTFGEEKVTWVIVFVAGCLLPTLNRFFFRSQSHFFPEYSHADWGDAYHDHLSLLLQVNTVLRHYSMLSFRDTSFRFLDLENRREKSSVLRLSETWYKFRTGPLGGSSCSLSPEICHIDRQ